MKFKFKYPLIENPFSKSDLSAGRRVLSSGKITMNKVTENFEKKICKVFRC